MNVIEEIDPKYFDQDYSNPSYIFHGSKELTDVLRAKKASCESKCELNEQTAVYGSSAFKGAIPFAIKGSGVYDCAVGCGPEDLIMKISYGVIPEDDFGYIYVCDAKGFVRCKNTYQFISYSDIVPIEVIKVYYKDFKECFKYIEDNQESDYHR